MISTLIRLGKQLSDNRGEWDDIIDYPNVIKEREKIIKYYVGELVFNLDLKIVYTVVRSEREYEENDCVRLKNIKIQGGNNKAIYCCVPSGKMEQIRKTFFGTTGGKGKPPLQGQLQELISKEYPQFSDSLLFSLLSQIFMLKNKFETQFVLIKPGKDFNDSIIDEKLLFNLGKTSGSDKIILIFASVISARNGIKESTPISSINGYDAFIKAKFFNKNQPKLTSDKKLKICYATGEMSENVSEVEFTDRFSLNKMFVKGTKNYAINFNKDNIGLNYQVNSDNQLYLSRASKYLLETQTVKIAGIDHCILPKFLSNSSVDVHFVLSGLHKKTDLLFQSAEYTDTIPFTELELEEPFWITYLAFETDGNFLKTINEIGNFSNIYLNKILHVLDKVDGFFRTELRYAVDWQSATNDYGKSWKLNLATIYSIIPIRKDNGKKNEVLALFKMIFESRKIELNKIYKHFCTLILCHRYNRYVSYKNIKKYDSQYFILAIRDAVFRYYALIILLKQLNLLEEDKENESSLIVKEDNDAPIEYELQEILFFKQMEYNSNQKAMFYLGRMLHIIAHTPFDKNKNLINKLNFNGMDKPDILSLRNTMLERARQFNIFDKVIFTDTNFNNFFNDTNWNMNREESIFFLLSGYSFGLIKN